MKANHKHSILQGKEKYCWVTGARNVPLEKHHVFYGTYHNAADKHGMWVYLVPELHRGTNGVHGKNGRALGLMLKQECQRKYEETHTREQFMEIFGRNYLDE